jgi:hypothetical protein
MGRTRKIVLLARDHSMCEKQQDHFKCSHLFLSIEQAAYEAALMLNANSPDNDCGDFFEIATDGPDPNDFFLRRVR